jgi:uncharacterized protein (DUF362 family)
MVASAVSLAGGIDAIGAGQTVFIKVNAVSDRAIGSAGIRTSPEVLAAVVRLVKARNPGRLIVGDRSARQFPDTARVFDVSGLGAAALDAGADEIFAPLSPAQDPGEWELMAPPRFEETWNAAGGVFAMTRLLGADHLVNVPTLKNHRFALFSLSMKNFIGAIGDSSRDPLHYLTSVAGDFEPLGRDIALLNQLFNPMINIVDATHALINGGPQGDGTDAVRTTPGMIFASADRVALDAACVSFLKLELSRTTVPMPDASQETLATVGPWQMPQIRNAVELGLGASGPAEVELRFDGVSDSSAIETIFRA